MSILRTVRDRMTEEEIVRANDLAANRRYAVGMKVIHRNERYRVTRHKVVLTQPTKGDFKAFSSTCTHQGCLATSSSDGEIPCPCHGSTFSIEDGSVINGPATTGLAAVDITVDGDSITQA